MDQPEESSSNPPRRIRRGIVEKVLRRGPGHDNIPTFLSEASENVLEDMVSKYIEVLFCLNINQPMFARFSQLRYIWHGWGTSILVMFVVGGFLDTTFDILPQHESLLCFRSAIRVLLYVHMLIGPCASLPIRIHDEWHSIEWCETTKAASNLWGRGRNHQFGECYLIGVHDPRQRRVIMYKVGFVFLNIEWN